MSLRRFATAQDVTALIALWQQAFPEDTEQEIVQFLGNVNLAEECLVAEEDGALVSMVFLLPTVLRASQPLPMQYIYAAATLPSHRGRGIFGDLLRQALSVARERGQVASFLRPAEPSLIDYYQPFGYRPFFYCDSLVGKAESLLLSVQPVSAQTYVDFRATITPPFGVEWPSRFLDNTVLVGQACAVCYPVGDRLLVRELLCPDGQEEAVCAVLATHFGCQTYECRVPATEANGQPFGLLCPLQPMAMSVTPPPYMGVALD